MTQAFSSIGESTTLNILFYVSIYNYFREVEPVIDQALRTGNRVRVILGWRGESADAAMAVLRAKNCPVEILPEKFCYLSWASTSLAPSTSSSGKSKPLSGTPQVKWLHSTRRFAVRLADAALHFLRQRDLLSVVRKYMIASRADAIFLGPAHSCGTADQAFRKLAQTEGIPTFCYPVSAYHGKIGAIRARFGNLKSGMIDAQIKVDYDLINRILAFFFPRWIAYEGNSAIFPWNPLVMLAAKINGLLEREVWQKPSPDFDLAFVYSDFSRQLLIDSGYPPEKIRVTGIPLLDRTLRSSNDHAVTQEIYADIGLPENSPFLLFNVEPSAEHHYMGWEEHWRNFEAMMTVARCTPLPVVLSLHPLCHLDDYQFAEDKFSVRIARHHKIYDLYPYCSAVLSFPCSTNVLAEIFDKPLVIYDFQRLAHLESERRDEFRLPGALVGHDPGMVQSLLTSLDLKKQTAPRDATPGSRASACNAMLDIVRTRTLSRVS